MGVENLNTVAITGNLTRDPELRSLPSGMSVCSLRIAFNTRRKGPDGEWSDKPNYVSVTVWGKQGENVARFMAKGKPVAIQGRLEWREWEQQDGGKREALEIVADRVQFLNDGGQGSGDGGGSGRGATGDPLATGGSDIPSDTTGFEPPASASGALPDDDIPF